jgi:hypothetical protein
MLRGVMRSQHRSRSRLRRSGVAVLCLGVALALAGCGPVTHSTAFPATNETGTVALTRQPVDVVDLTGSVTGVEVAEMRYADGGSTGGAEAIGSGVYLYWLGGACEERSRILVMQRDATYVLRLRTEGKIVLGCPGIGIYRAVLISFREPMAGKPLEIHLD